MNEDDTFNALRRIPYSKMGDIVERTTGCVYTDEWWDKNVFHPNYWTIKDYREAWNRTEHD